MSASFATLSVGGNAVTILSSWLVARRALLITLLCLGLAAPALAQSNLNPDLAPEWKDAAGQLRWPPNDGCAAAPVKITLAPGTELDRFGSEFGRFFANPGVSWDARALPYDRTKLPYAVYVVQQPLVVGLAAVLLVLENRAPNFCKKAKPKLLSPMLRALTKPNKSSLKLSIS
jgi:hypothetical protein